MSDQALGDAMYRNFCEMWRAVGIHADEDAAFDVQDRPNLLLVRSRLAHRVPHMVLDPRYAPGDEREWVSSVVVEFAGEPVSVTIMLPPRENASTLAYALQNRGFMRSLKPSVAMVRLGGGSFDFRADDAIQRVANDADLHEARQVLASVFSLPAHVFAFYTPLPVVQTYILREQGVGVAAACLCPFAGVAGVYSVGVLPQFRGRGFARRLVLGILSDAADLGLSASVLSCERELVPLYRRLGYVVVCELVSYWMEALWR
jgi:GNAT superfamily N-acetyltransferase